MNLKFIRIKQARALVIMCFFLSYSAFADDDVQKNLSVNLTLSSLPEAKTSVQGTFIFPFLAGTKPLTEGNNIQAVLRGELSPISLNGVAEFTWTPIAFFQLVAGWRIGSGWNIELFGSQVRGLGIQRRQDDGSVLVDGDAFDGIFWSSKAGAVLQFDLAAVVPGDWNHVVFRTYHEINYAAYTAAKPDEPWYFENDYGENMNGFNYYGNYLLGYQMPIFLNTIGILAEAENYLYTTPNRKLWGDHITEWKLAALFDFTVTKNIDIALIAQFLSYRNFTPETQNAEFYQDRRIENSNSIIKFYRAALIATFVLLE